MIIPDPVIDVLVQMESEGRVSIIGDGGNAYGCLQIWQDNLTDANQVMGTKWTLQDMLGTAGAARSRVVLRAYMSRYCTFRQIGRQPTLVDAARIWNGGPKGWRKNSTLVYADKFIRFCKARGIAYV